MTPFSVTGFGPLRGGCPGLGAGQRRSERQHHAPPRCDVRVDCIDERIHARNESEWIVTVDGRVEGVAGSFPLQAAGMSTTAVTP